MYACMLVSPDGDYVIDYEGTTIDEVVDKVVDRGSQYYFYPFEFIVRHPFNLNGYVVDHPYYNFKKRIKISKLLQAFQDTYNRLSDNEEIEYDAYIEMVFKKFQEI